MDYETITVARDGSVVRLHLNRPQARNAMNRRMVQELLHYFSSIREDRTVRVVVLAANGPTFCAGGDIKEMRSSLTQDRETQLQEGKRFDKMLTAVNQAPQVVVACVHGAVLGGGVGLVCVADMVVMAQDASVRLPEVRLGLVPALISPYVVARIGLARARQWMLAGTQLDGAQAVAAGLATAVSPAADLDTHVNSLVGELLQASPHALAACKTLLFAVSHRPPAETLAYRVDLLNELRASEEGQEGMLAFMQKRPPRWVEEI